MTKTVDQHNDERKPAPEHAWRRLVARYLQLIVIVWLALGALILGGLTSPVAALTAGGVASVALIFLAQAHQRDIYAARRSAASEVRERYRRLNASPLRARIVEAIRDPLLIIRPDKRIIFQSVHL